jgi:hypothetical protein
MYRTVDFELVTVAERSEARTVFGRSKNRPRGLQLEDDYDDDDDDDDDDDA